MKTKPISLRFNREDLELAAKKSGITKPQRLVDFLISEYVREFKPSFVASARPPQTISVPEPAVEKPSPVEVVKKKPPEPKKKTKDQVEEITAQSDKHALWKQGDPREGSFGFYVKYNCYNYDELQKLNDAK